MKTYLVAWFNSDGCKSSEITERLMSMGFRAIRGNYDYMYEWGSQATMDDVIRLGDLVHETLKGCNVTFKLETV
jgi:hypothetical protein